MKQIRNQIKEIKLRDDKEDLHKQEEWSHSKVISLKEVKNLMRAFKAMGLKEDSDNLIFRNDWDLVFRRPGEQRRYYCLLTKQEKADWDKSEEEFQKRAKEIMRD